MKKLNSRVLFVLTLAMVLSTMICYGQSNTPTQVAFKNVRVFDGTSDKLSATTEVLVEGNKIKEISANASKNASKDATIINGANKVLMPGIIEGHSHLAFSGITLVIYYSNRKLHTLSAHLGSRAPGDQLDGCYSPGISECVPDPGKWLPTNEEEGPPSGRDGC